MKNYNLNAGIFLKKRASSKHEYAYLDDKKGLNNENDHEYACNGPEKE